MKLVKNAEVALGADPRLLDREAKHRLRAMVFLEKVRGPWANVLYTLRDDGRITRDQADAGDKYWKLTKEYREQMATEPQTELEVRRVQRVKERYKSCLESMGLSKRFVDDVVFENVWPVGERGHLTVSQGLEMLRGFFDTGTKRKHIIRKAHLTEVEAGEIRSSALTVAELSKMYGVSEGQVSKIRSGKSR
jgi:hypothetical protein